MTEYRQLPITVEAKLLTQRNLHEVAAWCGGTVMNDVIYIPSIEGVTVAKFHQYVVCGVDGVFYASPADVFEKTHELAS